MQRQAYHGTNIGQTSLKGLKDDQIQYGIDSFDNLLTERVAY